MGGERERERAPVSWNVGEVVEGEHNLLALPQKVPQVAVGGKLHDEAHGPTCQGKERQATDQWISAP